MKNNKGITLISLIITIVVMLILVAATLTITLGENGIIAKAREAQAKTQEGSSKEEGALTGTGVETKINDVLEGKSAIITTGEEPAEEIKVGDTVTVRLKNPTGVNLTDIDGWEDINFDNDKCISIMPPVENVLDCAYFQFSGLEGEDAIIYLTQGTNALGNTIGQSGWYRVITDGQIEQIQDISNIEFTATINRIDVTHMDYLRQAFEISK